MPCDPAGPLRESLTSLLIRTAAENEVSPTQLLERKFRSDTSEGLLHCTSRSLGISVGQSINGPGSFARAFVARAEELTRLSNLQASTALCFGPLTTKNGLMRKHLAWSPEFLQLSAPIYYPLLWALEPVRVCSKTRQPLISRCPNCRNPISTFSGGSRVGLCNRCGTNLSATPAGGVGSDSLFNLVKDLDYEIWIANQLGDFIRESATGTATNSHSYFECLHYWMEAFELRNASAVAKALGTTSAVVCTWLQEQSTPRLRTTLNLCWVLGVSLLEFVRRKIPESHDGRLRAPVDLRVPRAAASRLRPHDKSALEQELTAILRESRFAMLSFTEICERQLHRRELVVRRNFPELARAIAKRYLDNRRLMAEVRQQQFCAAIQTTARFLHARGIVPNHKTLSPYLDRASKLRCAWALSALRQIRIKLGYENMDEQLLLPI
jgi:hypothetical protein